MHTRTIAAELAAPAALMLTACEGTDTASGKPSSVQSANDQPPAASNAPATDDEKTVTLPDMIGKGLQSAHDQAQAAGFYSLTSHDALGRGRMQAFDRSWKVCSQTPTPGEHPTDTKVDFATVKLEESCPATDEGAAPQAAGSTTPDFTSKSMKVARQTLDSSMSITLAP
ncbi:PASTA domain-containing protein [Streptomyces sp. NBC_01643]|uniref:PASTA domain-containing protein n=1 Tax=Streptomyces sp. NBC_01643 TaxID=2975906 RepID=UPI00386D8BA9|nr:PASTA domain-containing protein [Streptomyces sp. NBC_01643]